MANSYSSLCDEFYVDMHINTELDLPSERDTVLHFFERIEKQFPSMSNFHRRENGDFCLEEDREADSYRWTTLELDRIGAGCVNPVTMEDAYELHRLVVDIAPYMLGVSHLDIESLDITFTMDFDYKGNHDEIIAEALYGQSAIGKLLDVPGTKPLSFAPTAIIALSDDCYLQARIAVESRTTAYEVRNNKFKADLPISLYLTIRRHPRPNEKFDPALSYLQQCRLAEELMAEKIIPCFAQPLINAIAQRR
jgi:hypothetical protein